MPSQFAVTLPCTNATRDELLTQLAETETTGLVESESSITAYFPTHALAAIWGTPLEIPATDYSSNWQHTWHAFPLGARWFLAPPWDDTPTPPNRLRLPMTPGNIFGSGDHPTTQMCLELLEAAPITPTTLVLDLGSGSGILSLAAKLLGAQAFACDLDPEAAHLTHSAGIPTWQGTLNSLRPNHSFYLLLANLPGGLLLDLLPTLCTLAPILLLSGYLDTQQSAVESHAQILAQRASGEWRAALLKVS